MTRVLIFGAAGMLGHKLTQVSRERFETWTSVRGEAGRYERFGLFEPSRLCAGVDVRDISAVERTIAAARPDVVVNAAGIVKQRPEAQDVDLSLAVNAVFPHQLAALCRAVGARLIHVSTDCVFSGRTGSYTEDDVPDAEDLYGRSKLLGEAPGEGVLIIRTSIIGRELDTAQGLVEWFLAQRERVRGFTHAIFSGLPTVVLAELIADLIVHHPALQGLYHVSASPTSKYELLLLLQGVYALPIAVEPDARVRVDRSLDSTRFRAATGFAPAPWSTLVERIAFDPTPYADWRKAYAS
jgi:dTDP-4-dehydrorhamnose reductase